jgi:hypothetical protein
MKSNAYQRPTFELVDESNETSVAAAGPVIIIIAVGLVISIAGCTK